MHPFANDSWHPLRGELGLEHGLPEACVFSCDNITTIPTDAFDDVPIGHLDEITRAPLDEALHYALDIVY